MIKKRKTIFHTKYYRYHTVFLRFDKSEFSFVTKYQLLNIILLTISATSINV